ncbi:MAG: hypothetical protein ACOYYJ_07680 [Chloroflexota bacterium]
MKTQNSVLLLGNSVFILGLYASLKDQTKLRVLHLDSVDQDAPSLLEGECPKVVIFDVNAPQTPVVVNLLLRCVQSVGIAFDLNQNTALVLTGQRRSLPSARELVDFIQRITSERKKDFQNQSQGESL